MAKDHVSGPEDYEALIEEVLEAYPANAATRRAKHLKVSEATEEEPAPTTGIASKCDTQKSNIKSIPGEMTVRGCAYA